MPTKIKNKQHVHKKLLTDLRDIHGMFGVHRVKPVQRLGLLGLFQNSQTVREANSKPIISEIHFLAKDSRGLEHAFLGLCMHRDGISPLEMAYHH